MGAAETTDEGRSISNLIAWLSLGIVAAAWGSTLDPSWQPLWKQMGAFGLASAVGLNFAERYRATRRLRTQQKALECRVERSIRTLLDGGPEEQDDAEVNAEPEQIESGGTREPRMSVSVRWPAVITPVGADGASSGTGRIGYIENVSKTGIGLAHRPPLLAGLVRVTFRRTSGQPIAMLMEVRWSRQVADERCQCGACFRSLAIAEALDGDLLLLEAFEQSTHPLNAAASQEVPATAC